MSYEWVQRQLDEVIELFNGKVRPKELGKIPVFGGNGVMDYTNTYNYQDENIIIGRVGAYCGNVNYHLGKIWVSDNAINIKPKPEVSYGKFIYYLLVFQNLHSKRIGSSQPLITQNIIKNIDVSVPTLKEQKAIANILSSLDDKIELNNKINKNLEELAQTLYKHWFVDFGFPNEDGLPYKSSGGKMVESELGLIPEDWDVKDIIELITFIGGSQPPKKEHIYEPKEGYIRFIQNRDYSGNDKHLTYIKNSNRNKLCTKHDIMMDKYGEAGKVRYGIEGAYNVALAKIDCEIEHRELLRKYFEQENIQGYILNSSQASTRPSVNASVFTNLKIAMPPINLLSKFNKFTIDIINNNLSIQKQNNELSNLRDLLLPKLMSGEIRIPLKE